MKKKIPLTPQAIARLEKNVPDDLRDINGWLCWRYDFSTESKKPKKIPISPETGFKADVNDVANWASLRQAIEACSHWDATGVGLTVIPSDNRVGVDLDDCRDAATGEIESWAQEIITALDSYTEVTPSGDGVRVWVRGRWLYEKHRIGGLGDSGKGRIEIYSHRRFFTVTGDHVEGTPSTIERRQAVLDGIYKRFWGEVEEQQPAKASAARDRSPRDDGELIRRACASKNGEKFRRLWNGQWENKYESQSEADMALCGQLAFFTNRNPQRMDTLFRKSGLYRASKWNQVHFGNGETYGQRTIRVAIQNTKSTIRMDAPGKKRPTDATICVADVKSRQLEWLWKKFIPKRKLSLLVGDPGNGKSLITLSLAASVTNGRPMPDGALCERGSVLLLNAEDAVDDTVRPRLEAAGADLRLCRFFPFISDQTGQMTVQIPNKLDELKNAINRHKPALVVIDPLAPFLASKIDTFKDQSVRSALAQLNELAEKTGTAIVLVVHLNKKEDMRMLYRPGASIAFVAASRSVLLAERDKDDEYTLSILKANLAARQNPFTYKIVGSKNQAPRIVWGSQRTTSTSADKGDSSPTSINALSDAKEFLLELLEQGPQKTASVIGDARQAGIALITLRRAKTELKIESIRVRFGPKGYWAWRLPTPVSQ